MMNSQLFPYAPANRDMRGDYERGLERQLEERIAAARARAENRQHAPIVFAVIRRLQRW